MCPKLIVKNVRKCNVKNEGTCTLPAVLINYESSYQSNMVNNTVTDNDTANATGTKLSPFKAGKTTLSAWMFTRTSYSPLRLRTKRLQISLDSNWNEVFTPLISRWCRDHRCAVSWYLPVLFWFSNLGEQGFIEQQIKLCYWGSAHICDGRLDGIPVVDCIRAATLTEQRRTNINTQACTQKLICTSH